MSLYDSTSLYDDATLSFDGYAAPLATMPAVGVFVAFDDTPYSTAPAWTEITEYVRNITIRRGRNDDTADFPSGTATLTLDNINRTFDPLNTASAYYGKTQPRKQIKIVANWNGIEYQLYRGYISGWPVTFTDAGFDSTITIDCFDLSGLLGAEMVNRNVVEDYTLSMNPRNFFPMSESPAQNSWPCRVDPRFALGEAGTVIVPGPGGTGGTIPWTSSSFYQSEPLKPAIKSMSVGCTVNFTPLIIGTPNSASTATTAGDFSVSMVIYTPALSGSSSLQMNFSSTVTGSVFAPEVDNTGLIKARTVVAGGSTTTSDDVRNRKGVHVVVTYSVSTNRYTIYIDGDTGTTGTAGAGTVGIFPLRGEVATSGSNQGQQWIHLLNNSTFQHLALWDRQLTQAEARNLSQAMLGQVQMATAERARYFLQGTTVPAAFYNISSTIASDVGDIPIDAMPLLPALRDLARGEGGELFVDRSGVLQFYSKDDVFNKTRSNTAQFTVTDTGTGVYYDSGQLSMQISADNIRNDLTVRGTADIETRVVDQTSVTNYGLSGEVVDTDLLDINEVNTLANRQLAVFKNPRVQIEPFTVKGQRDPSYMWPRVLDIELLDKFTFVRTPAVGSAFSQDMLVQSVEHRITPETWETVINGSARYANWFIVGVSLIGGDDLLLN